MSTTQAPPWARDGLEVVGRGGTNRQGSRGVLTLFEGRWYVGEIQDPVHPDTRSAGPYDPQTLDLLWRPAEQPPQDIAEQARPNVSTHLARERAARAGGVAPLDAWCSVCAAPSDETCRPVPGIDPPTRPLVHTCGAVLHELRRSGPLGLHVDEILERIGSPLVASAIATLAEEGRVVVRDGLVRMSEAQREIEGLRAEEARPESFASQIHMIGERLARDPEAVAGRTIAEEVLRLLDKARAAQGREHAASPAHDVVARPHAAIGKRLNRLHEACAYIPLERSLEPYRQALADASWIASYGHEEPRLLTVRVILGSSSTIRCAVLGLNSEGQWLLSSPSSGRSRFTTNGASVDGAPWARIHPDDLAALRGERSAALASAQVEG